MYRRIAAGLLIGGICALAVACGGSGPRVGAIRLGGVDLIYALRRIAGAAGVPFVIDEMYPKDSLGDFELRRVRFDFAGGTLEEALAELREGTPGWTYELDDNGLYVRSELIGGTLAQLDEPRVGGGTLETDLKGLVQWLGHQNVPVYLIAELASGAAAPKVELKLEPDISAVTVLRRFAAALPGGLLLRRAGHIERVDDDRISIQGSTVAPLSALVEPAREHATAGTQSTLRALADVEARTRTPITALDHSVLGDPRGYLDQDGAVDPKLPLRESLDALGNDESGRPVAFIWKQEGPVATLYSRAFASQPQRELLAQEKLKSGRVRGTLVDLAEWINDNRIEPSERVLMMGEQRPGAPVAELEIAEGTTVRAALVAFARVSGAGWYYAVFDTDSVVLHMTPPPHAWKGAHLTPLTDWVTAPAPVPAPGS